MISELEALERIERKNRSWRSKFAREHSIWEEIAVQINSYTGEKQKYWERVMDLYRAKYQ